MVNRDNRDMASRSSLVTVNRNPVTVSRNNLVMVNPIRTPAVTVNRNNPGRLVRLRLPVRRVRRVLDFLELTRPPPPPYDSRFSRARRTKRRE
jgi:hypothetical protein